jgi:predicted amidohydrolase
MLAAATALRRQSSLMVRIRAQCKARWPEVIDKRFFNTLFVISRQGEIVHKAAKNHLWCLWTPPAEE